MLTLLEHPSGRPVDINAPLTLAEYLALPDDSRIEIIEGILRPMTRATTKGSQVQNRLAILLEQQCPSELLVAPEEIVVSGRRRRVRGSRT